MPSLVLGLSVETFLWGALLAPLAGFVLNGLVALAGGEPSATRRGWAVTIGVAAPAVAFLMLATAFFFLANLGPAETVTTQPLFTWMAVGSAAIPVQLKFDSLSGLLSLIVTGVGTLIHIYSVGYMKEDRGVVRYFAFLNLFIFEMLLLILGSSLPLLFIGWEGVGLTSYLLIGFWFDDVAKARAGSKAFIVNRIGDAGMLVAMLLIFKSLPSEAVGPSGPWSFATLEASIEALRPMAPWIAASLFVGAVGKSAQIPLYVWLPDAMAGPTPVSALIHAATMVTAGVYLICRMHFLFVAAPVVMQAIAVTGMATALFAATMGLVANDIKKVLAYSTISQLGYMIAACGAGAFVAAIFHLTTHAFFKACLFLGAGSVIHACGGNQDIQSMGGLHAKLKSTSLPFLAAALALAGIAPLAGFFSKDEILFGLMQNGHAILWGVGLVTGGLTAFYSLRLFALVFLGKSRATNRPHGHHPSPAMTIPVAILGILSLLGGGLGLPHFLGAHPYLHQWLGPLFESSMETAARHAVGDEKELLFAVISLLVALHAAVAAYILYTQRLELAARIASKVRYLYKILAHRYWIDELYEWAVVKPLVWVSTQVLWRGGDGLVIERGGVGGAVAATSWAGRAVQKMQGGLLSQYALVLLMGALGLVLWFVLGGQP